MGSSVLDSYAEKPGSGPPQKAAPTRANPRGVPGAKTGAQSLRSSGQAGVTVPLGGAVLLGFAEGVEIDAELLALLVEMAAFEAEGASDVGHVEIVTAYFDEESFALEGFGAFDESALGGAGSVDGDGHAGGTGSGEGEAHVVGRDRLCVGEKD